jgi:histidinol-phosphate aminotransferase
MLCIDLRSLAPALQFTCPVAATQPLQCDSDVASAMEGAHMQDWTPSTEERSETLIGVLARSAAISREHILPVPNITDSLVALLKGSHSKADRLHVIGHCTPDIAIAADRADMTPHEHFGNSAFTLDPKGVLRSLPSGLETVYVANPNRVTGTALGQADLEMIAAAVPDGLVIVDEFHFDTYGLSIARLTARYDNVVALRSFAPILGSISIDAGYLLGHPRLLAKLAGDLRSTTAGTNLNRMVVAALDDSQVRSFRQKIVRDESTRVTRELSALGLQCRITSADFILIRVQDPVRTGNALAQSNVHIVNLDGYPGLRGYLKYTIAGTEANDSLLRAFAKMPTEYYEHGAPSKRRVTMKKGMEVAGSNRATVGIPVATTESVALHERKEKELV